MTTTEKKIGTAANFVDERLGAAKWVKKSLNKVFPDHWTFMFGEVCMYSFIILLLSGTFLTLALLLIATVFSLCNLSISLIKLRIISSILVLGAYSAMSSANFFASSSNFAFISHSPFLVFLFLCCFV